jgi:hypothetical protein
LCATDEVAEPSGTLRHDTFGDPVHNVEGLTYRLPLSGNRHAGDVKAFVASGKKACSSVGCRIVEEEDLVVEGKTVAFITKAELFEVSLVYQGLPRRRRRHERLNRGPEQRRTRPAAVLTQAAVRIRRSIKQRALAGGPRRRPPRPSDGRNASHR